MCHQQAHNTHWYMMVAYNLGSSGVVKLERQCAILFFYLAHCVYSCFNQPFCAARIIFCSNCMDNIKASSLKFIKDPATGEIGLWSCLICKEANQNFRHVKNLTDHPVIQAVNQALIQQKFSLILQLVRGKQFGTKTYKLSVCLALEDFNNCKSKNKPSLVCVQ